jgi:hypothetical protein
MSTPGREPAPPRATEPVLAPLGASAASASRPDRPLDGATYHIYEAHPAPWWVTAIWIGFFVFALVYLITSLTE